MRIETSLLVPLLTVGAMQILVATVGASPPGDLLRDADAKFRERRNEEVLELTSRAIERDGELVAAFRLRAAAHEALGRYERGIRDLDRALQLQPDSPDTYQARGVLHFKAGNVRPSIADFDRFLKAYPQRRPHHWQRGISYYYAGEFEKGVGQFESHQLVNPQDVENAIWHYLCKARVDGVERAREGLIEITSDRRPWAMPVYRMFRGKAQPQDVLKHAQGASPSESGRKNDLFYAHLYVGLFHEAAGRPDQARKHIKIAVEKYPSPHYMGDVARVHLQLRDGETRN